MLAEKQSPSTQPEKVEKPNKCFLKLPYTGRKCEGFAYRMKKTIENTFEDVEFNV
jgi:hypothetical protein